MEALARVRDTRATFWDILRATEVRAHTGRPFLAVVVDIVAAPGGRTVSLDAIRPPGCSLPAVLHPDRDHGGNHEQRRTDRGHECGQHPGAGDADALQDPQAPLGLGLIGVEIFLRRGYAQRGFLRFLIDGNLASTGGPRCNEGRPSAYSH